MLFMKLTSNFFVTDMKKLDDFEKLEQNFQVIMLLFPLEGSKFHVKCSLVLSFHVSNVLLILG